MRVLIVDDELLSRSLLRRMLEAKAITVVGEAEDAEAGIVLAEELSPDVVFLDVRMPGVDGMDAIEIFTQMEPAPFVILVTGYSEYALTAFDRSVFDYILKPVSEKRLGAALAKARKQLAMQRKAKRSEGLGRLTKPGTIRRLPIRVRGSIRLVPFEKILYAVASAKSVSIKTRDAEYRTTYTLTHLEGELPATFMRVHASCIVNLAAIEEILLLGNHTYAIKLATGEELPLGRQQYQKLQERLGFPSEES